MKRHPTIAIAIAFASLTTLLACASPEVAPSDGTEPPIEGTDQAEAPGALPPPEKPESMQQPELAPLDGEDPPGVDEAALCGGPEGIACDDGSYCQFADDDACGDSGALGTCVPRSPVCRKDCRGVCGCDGQSYCNACSAQAQGVSVRRAGRCDQPPR